MSILISGEEIKEEMILPYCLYEDVEEIPEIIERDPESPKQIKIGDKLFKVPEVLRVECKFGFTTTTMRMNKSNGDLTYNVLFDDIFFDRVYSAKEIGVSLIFGYKGNNDILPILKKKNDAEYFRATDKLKYWGKELRKAPNSKSIQMIVDYHKNVIGEYLQWYDTKHFNKPDKRSLKKGKYNKPGKIGITKLFIEAWVKTYPEFPKYDLLSRLVDSPSVSNWRIKAKESWIVEMIKEEIKIQLKSKRTPLQKKELLKPMLGITEFIISENGVTLYNCLSNEFSKSVKGSSTGQDEFTVISQLSKKGRRANVFQTKEEAQDSAVSDLFNEESQRGIYNGGSTSKLNDMEDEENLEY